MRRNVVLVLISGLAASSQGFVVIDDFAAPQSLMVTGTSTVVSNGLVTSGALGGVRRLLGINDLNPNNSFTFIDVNGGLATIASGPRVDPRVEFGYGAAVNGSRVDMNANLAAGNDRFRILFDSNDQNLTLGIFIRSTTHSGGNYVTAFSRFVAGGRPTTAFTEDLLFSSIRVDPAVLTDVDQLIIQFNTTAGGDVSLRGFQAVPEPTSLAALTLGAAALLRRRRA